MARGDEGERRRHDLRARKPKRVEAEFKRKRTVHEKRDVRFGHSEGFRKPPLKTLQHRTVVRKPPIAPYLLAAGLESFKVGKIRPGDQDRFVKALHG